MAKQVTGQAKFQVPGGTATPAPPVGTSLGKYGINLGQVVMQFNERTREFNGMPIPVVVTVYNDRSFEFITKSPPAAALLKKAAGLAKGSGVPNKNKVGTVTKKQVEEIAKLKAMGRLWTEIGRERYGVEDPKMLRFRYGVQVNSLGLTEAQPENNVQRIVIEALAVILARDARARALQLPAWNEAMGLPRPWDQQWSLRIQQVLAFESDVCATVDPFAGSYAVEAMTDAQWSAVLHDDNEGRITNASQLRYPT